MKTTSKCHSKTNLIFFLIQLYNSSDIKCNFKPLNPNLSTEYVFLYKSYLLPHKKKMAFNGKSEKSFSLLQFGQILDYSQILYAAIDI